MGTFLRHDPCPKCGSSDNLGVYEEEGGRMSASCFGCQHYIHNHGGINVEPTNVLDFDSPMDSSPMDTNNLPFGTHKHRKVTVEVAELFGVRRSYDTDGNVDSIHYPYPHTKGTGLSHKIRGADKSFRTVGGLKGVKLFGQDQFSKGGKQIVITEGEEDALAVAQAMMYHYKKLYPVVSIPSSTNMKVVAENLEFLQSFKSVIIWTDNDEAGEKARSSLAKIIGYSRCKVANSKSKDASDLLQADNFRGILEAIWNSTTYNPQGILGKEQLWNQVIEYSKVESVPYPDCFSGLNLKTKGKRFGEISLFTSGTGAGKSTILREVANSLLETTPDKVGIISLEESPAETAKKMAALRLNKNPSSTEIPLEELKGAFDEVFGDDRVLVLDHQGAITESITDQLHYMASMGCKYLFIDHITILVSEGAEGLTGNEAVDKVMNDLLKVAKTHNVWIGLISHLRKSDKVGKSFEQGNLPSLDDIRGSGSIKQVSMDVIAFARNAEAGENTIEMRVLKCRHTGLTGDAGCVSYDNVTGRLSAAQDLFDEVLA